MIEAEGNTQLLVAHVRRIRFLLDARACRAWRYWTAFSEANQRRPLIGCIPDR
jgi:hypothetical protein